MSRETNSWKSFDLLRGSNLRPLATSPGCLTTRPPELTTKSDGIFKGRFIHWEKFTRSLNMRFVSLRNVVIFAAIFAICYQKINSYLLGPNAGRLRGLAVACWTTQVTTTRVRISAWPYPKVVSSSTSPPLPLEVARPI